MTPTPAASDTPLTAHALLLAERLELRGLPREGAALHDPVPVANQDGFTAVAFRRGDVLFIGATPAQQAGIGMTMRSPGSSKACATSISAWTPEAVIVTCPGPFGRPFRAR
jgi:hypothetical protein